MLSEQVVGIRPLLLNAIVEHDADHAKNNQSKKYSRKARKFGLLVHLFTGQLLTWGCLTMPAGFTGNALKDKGGNNEFSFFMQITIFTMACSGLLFSKCQKFFGARMQVLSGLVILAISQCCLGYLDYIEEPNTLLLIGSIFRVMQGIAQGSFVVSIMTLAFYEFKHEAAIALGIGESGCVIGSLCGPIFGSLLYRVFERTLLPCVVAAALLFLLLFAGMGLLSQTRKRKKQKKYEKYNFAYIFIDPTIIMVIGVTITIFGICGVFMTNLRFEEYSGITWKVALPLGASFYFVGSIVFGYLTSIGVRIRRFVFIASTISLPYIMLLWMPGRLPISVFMGITAFGLISSAALTSGFSELISVAFKDDFVMLRNFEIYSTVSGVWNFVRGIALVSFPLIVAPLREIVPFAEFLSLSIMLGCSVAFVSSLIVTVVSMYKEPVSFRFHSY